MSTTITGKLNKAASEFQAGESTGFGVRLGVQYYDRETKQKEWTNYECVIFAKAQGQIDFYRSALTEGAVVEVSAPEAKVRTFEGSNGLQISIELLNASLGYIHNADRQPQQTQQRNNTQQAPQKQAPKGARCK